MADDLERQYEGLLRDDAERRVWRAAAGIRYPDDDSDDSEFVEHSVFAALKARAEGRKTKRLRLARDIEAEQKLVRDYNKLRERLQRRLEEKLSEDPGYIGVPWDNAGRDAAEVEAFYRRYFAEKAGGADMLDRPPMTPEELAEIKHEHPWVKWHVEQGKLTEHDRDVYRDERLAMQQRGAGAEEAEAEIGEEEEEEEEEEEADDADDLSDEAMEEEEAREAEQDEEERAEFEATVAQYKPLIDRMFAAVPEMTAESAFALLMHDDAAPEYFTAEERAMFDELRDAQDPVLYEALVEGRAEESASRMSNYRRRKREIEEEAAREAEEAAQFEEEANEVDEREWNQFYTDIGPLIDFHVREQLTSEAFDVFRINTKKAVVKQIRKTEPDFRVKDDDGKFIKEAVDRINSLTAEKIKKDVIMGTALAFLNEAHTTNIPLGVVDKYRRFNVNNDARRLSDAFGEEERLSIAEKLMRIVEKGHVEKSLRHFRRYNN